jgi:hypothetical protein
MLLYFPSSLKQIASSGHRGQGYHTKNNTEAQAQWSWVVPLVTTCDVPAVPSGDEDIEIPLLRLVAKEDALSPTRSCCCYHRQDEGNSWHKMNGRFPPRDSWPRVCSSLPLTGSIVCLPWDHPERYQGSLHSTT